MARMILEADKDFDTFLTTLADTDDSLLGVAALFEAFDPDTAVLDDAFTAAQEELAAFSATADKETMEIVNSFRLCSVNSIAP